MDLVGQNHWWASGGVRKDLLGRERRLTGKVASYLPRRQAILLKGLRRAGKTTIMLQLIDSLLRGEGVKPTDILYFSFDEQVENVREVVTEYVRNIARCSLDEGGRRLYLFFDEIQKVGNWASQIKLLYDLHPELKICVSGSAALNLMKDAKESLSGRIFEFTVEPLDFEEYLTFSGIDVDMSRLELYRDEIAPRMARFAATSGFIEMLSEDDPEVLRKYFLESVLERIIFRDVPDTFHIDDPELMMAILRLLAATPGMTVDYSRFARELGRDQRTIAKYFEVLRLSFLVSPLYQFSRSLRVSERKRKKYYLSRTAFAAALRGGLPAVADFAESLAVQNLCARFFYHTKTGHEVDMVLTSGKRFLPVEVKYSNVVHASELRGTASLMARESLDEGVVLTRDYEGDVSVRSGRVKAVPLWKGLLEIPHYA